MIPSLGGKTEAAGVQVKAENSSASASHVRTMERLSASIEPA
jgi:hypothetical protein